MSLEVSDRTKAVLDGLDAAYTESLMEMGEVAEKHAREYVPVRTGFLRDSIHHRMDGDRAVDVYTDTEYAADVEFGTVRQRAQPYMRPALDNHVMEYREIFIKHIQALDNSGTE